VAVREARLRWQPTPLEDARRPAPTSDVGRPATPAELERPESAVPPEPVPPRSAPTPGRVLEVVDAPLPPVQALTDVLPPVWRVAGSVAGAPPDEPSDAADRPVAVEAPVPLQDNAPPRYPAAARRRGQEGLVVLLVQVDADGGVASVSVATSSGHALLDRAAREAVESWRFEPGRRDGRAEARPLEVPIRFRLTAPQDD
jgi:protein TonB